MHHPLSPRGIPKYQHILEQLQRDVLSGEYPPGARVPSEAALTKRFGASRITVGRAVRELRQRGLVERRAGSGTFVAPPKPASGVPPTPPGNGGRPFGLLIPDLGETEIFAPMRQGMAAAPSAGQHALLWGYSAPDEAAAGREEAGWRLCRQYVEQGVGGVFFAPFERTANRHQVNRRIVTALEEAHIPVVLLDRDLVPYPRRSRHDLVGIDNRRAGYLACEHLLARGSQRVAFVAYPDSASTVDARAAGYREALFQAGQPVESALIPRLDPTDEGAVGAFLAAARPDAAVCANDRVAGQLMHTLLALGRRVPEDLRLVGIDDVGYASLLPVPLTTIHQPCREIGTAAMTTMVERVARPQAPARDILLDCHLVVRQSCGARARPSGATTPPAAPALVGDPPPSELLAGTGEPKVAGGRLAPGQSPPPRLAAGSGSRAGLERAWLRPAANDQAPD